MATVYFALAALTSIGFCTTGTLSV